MAIILKIKKYKCVFFCGGGQGDNFPLRGVNQGLWSPVILLGKREDPGDPRIQKY